MHDGRQSYSHRFGRIDQIVRLIVTVVSASLAAYWLVKWLRGDPDEYPNQIIGGLTLTSAMAFLTSAQLVRSGIGRWLLAGSGAMLLAITLSVVFAGVRVTPLTVVGLLLSVGSIVRTAHVLWPARGIGLAEWSKTPVTLEQRRSVCSGIAILNLGVALVCVSIFDLTRGPWDATAVAAVTTLMFLGAAVMFLVLRSRIRA